MRQVRGTWLPDADTYFERALDPSGGFQIDHLTRALALCPMRRTAVDCGAHVGTWTRVLAREFERVIAIEPARDVFACLERNVEGIGNVTCIRAAVSDSPGRRYELRDDVTRLGNTGSRYLAPASIGNSVPILTIDSLPLAGLDFLKLDVEGHELAALWGGRASILKSRPTVIMEAKNLGRGGDPELADAYLRSLGAAEVDRIGKDRIYRWPP